MAGRQLRAHGLVEPGLLVDYYLALLVDRDVSTEARAALTNYVQEGGGFVLDDATVDKKVRGMIHLTMSLSTFQLA